MAKIVKVDGEEIAIQPDNGVEFLLEEMQSIVGGYIEVLYLSDGRLMVVNEEGLLRKLPFNPIATTMASRIIVGDVLVCEQNQIR